MSETQAVFSLRACSFSAERQQRLQAAEEQRLRRQCPAGLLQQAMQMKAQLEEAQKSMVAEYEAAGIKVTVGGDFSVRDVIVSPELASCGDPELLQDAIAVAVNGAMEKIRDQMGKQLGGLGLPGF